MKRLVRSIRTVHAIAIAISILFANGVSAEYLGELCWTLHITQRDDAQADES